MFRGARKEELILIADELGEIINPEMKVLDLKNLILNSDKYKTDKVFIDDYLDSIIADRKSKEEQERLTEQSKLEFEKIKLEQIKLEIELGKINLERAKVDSQRDSNDLQRINPETNQTSIENFIQNNSNDEFGKITLSSAFGENVEAKLIKTSITLDNNSLNHPMDCLVAITDKLNAEALIPPSLYEALCSINNETNENDIFAESIDSFTPFSTDENDAESGNEIFYVESDSDNLNFNSDYSKMKDEQNNCDSLKKVRAELKLNKGNFLLVEELIYHRDKILNEPVMQLVLPRCRIDKVMKLAHELLYGREARGPLAILKSSWAGEIHLPTNISQSAADYLQEMKIKMEKAAESASLTAAQKQKSYGDYFNKRSSVKNFSIGEQVVLLIPDSSNKIYARWTGPGEIIQHHPPHSYKVKLPDGTVRHVHVNKIRKYHPRALAVGVIFEDDHEFGEIHPTPNLLRSTSERVLHETDLNHLKETEREQVLAILLKHRTLFTSDVKIAKVGAHRIRLKPNIERKKPFLLSIMCDTSILCGGVVFPPLTRRRTVSPYRKNVLFAFERDSFSAPAR
ncbi:retrovirus-related Pol polyprotein from transposon 17.6 [Trichonephila clavata]|uniref:Retrovirus-related Pol polyprotein from transposon 17.6 n=1 Tax=Trichonephila clavata TaxID=2740835 RepID=A0A8X6L6N7_TRICU|nr:retrovirus-related Pol polyprotein from transposon 17.6 [Trichonephila clavata]